MLKRHFTRRDVDIIAPTDVDVGVEFNVDMHCGQWRRRRCQINVDMHRGAPTPTSLSDLTSTPQSDLTSICITGHRRRHRCRI